MARKKILIVDDVSDNIRTIIDLMEGEARPYEFLQAMDGRTGIEVARKLLPDLIISDWEMPGMTGIDMMKLLKQDPNTKDIPIIIRTGVMTSTSHLEIALQAGAVDFIRTPVDKLELLARINSMLQLADSIKTIKAITATKEFVFSVIAHDLKNLFGNINSILQILPKNLDNTEKLKHFIELARTTSDATNHLLENLLFWAYNSTGSLSVSAATCSLSDMVPQVVQTVHLMASKKRIEIETEVEGSLSVQADRHMIETVLRNLLLNAVKFSTEGGRIQVVVKAENESVVVSVRDEGVGMSPETLKKILSPDNHYSTPGTNNERGSGIGLTVCQQLLQMNGSALELESEFGNGTLARFTLRE